MEQDPSSTGRIVVRDLVWELTLRPLTINGTLSETAGFARRLPLLQFHVQARFKSGVAPLLEKRMISSFGIAMCHEGCVTP